MSKVARIIGIIICIALAIGLAFLAIRANDTMYVVYLILAGLLGVVAGIIKNAEQKPDS